MNTTAAILVCFTFSCLATTKAATGENKPAELSAADMSAWGDHVGEWRVVESATMDEENPKLFALRPGTGVLVNGDSGRTQNLFSVVQHGDVQAHIEFMVPKGSNSGVYFQGRYEVQILDSWGKAQVSFGDCGGIYQRWGKQGGYEGHAPQVNASLPPGRWQTFDVTFRAPRFDKDGNKTANAIFLSVVHNGKRVHENVEVTGPTRAAGFRDERPLGPLLLQGDHGPVAYRNLRLTGVVKRPAQNSANAAPLEWYAATDAKPRLSIPGPQSAVVFDNQWDGQAQLFGAEYRGHLQLYDILESGASQRQNTRWRNTWLVADENAHSLGHVIADPIVSPAGIPFRK